MNSSKQNFDIFYLLFDFDPQYSRETLLNFEFPTFEMIETLFNKYHDIKNDNHQRCMIWLDILKISNHPRYAVFLLLMWNIEGMI